MSVKKTIPIAEKPVKTNAKGRVAPPAPAAKGKAPASAVAAGGGAAGGAGATKPKAKRATTAG